MKELGRTAFLAIATLSAPLAVSAQQSFDLTTEELEPLSMIADGAITGLSTDLLKTAFARAGLPAEMHLYPWLRAYRSALDKDNGCVYSTVRTPEREALFKWVGPIVHDDWVIFVPEDSEVRVASLADLKRYRTASTPGDALALYMRSQGIPVEFTPTNGQLQMLMSGRIDFWATTQTRGTYFAAHDHVKLKAVLTLRQTDMYLACNRKVPDRIIALLNGTLKAMEADGTAERLAAPYR